MEEKNKEKYESPATLVVEMKTENSILALSNYNENDWFEE